MSAAVELREILGLARELAMKAVVRSHWVETLWKLLMLSRGISIMMTRMIMTIFFIVSSVRILLIWLYFPTRSPSPYPSANGSAFYMLDRVPCGIAEGCNL